MPSDGQTQRQVKRAVRLGEQLPTPELARLALERIPVERRNAGRSRTGVLFLCLLPLAGILLGIVDGDVTIVALGVIWLLAMLPPLRFYRTFERNLQRAEELNRARLEPDL